MVRAILEGRKTQTRRVLKPQPIAGDCGWDWTWVIPRKFKCTPGTANRWRNDVTPTLWPYLPYNVGDRLWVRGTWCDPEGDRQPRYFADLSDADVAEHKRLRKICGRLDVGARFKSGRYMPRWASRLTLAVTEVRVQRLQEISEDDAQAEGAPPWAGAEQSWRAVFFNIWREINGPDTWAANPWVVALTFVRAQ